MPLIFLLSKNTPRSNFKIQSIMKQSEFISLKMIANILHEFSKECVLSEDFVKLPPGHTLFEDSCKAVQFKRNISDLMVFLDTAYELAKIVDKG